MTSHYHSDVELTSHCGANNNYQWNSYKTLMQHLQTNITARYISLAAITKQLVELLQTTCDQFYLVTWENKALSVDTPSNKTRISTNSGRCSGATTSLTIQIIHKCLYTNVEQCLILIFSQSQMHYLKISKPFFFLKMLKSSVVLTTHP